MHLPFLRAAPLCLLLFAAANSAWDPPGLKGMGMGLDFDLPEDGTFYGRFSLVESHELPPFESLRADLPVTTFAWVPTEKRNWYSLNPVLYVTSFMMAWGGGDYTNEPGRFNGMGYGKTGFALHLIQAVPNAGVSWISPVKGLRATVDHKTDVLVNGEAVRVRYEQRAGVQASSDRFYVRAGVSKAWLPVPEERGALTPYVAFGIGEFL